MKPGEHGQLWYAVLAFGIAVAAFLAAWGLHGNTSSTYRVDGQWSAFTGLFILALAIERALEPFSRKLGPDTTRRKEAKDRVLASTRAEDMKEIAVECQLAVEMCRRLTAVVTWGVATGLAFLEHVGYDDHRGMARPAAIRIPPICRSRDATPAAWRCDHGAARLVRTDAQLRLGHQGR
jgi:hypothetical protein